MKEIDIEIYLIKLLQKRKKIPGNILNNIKKFNFLNEGHIDSLELIHFILEIENKFKITFSPEQKESSHFRTVGGLTKLIIKNLKN